MRNQRDDQLGQNYDTFGLSVNASFRIRFFAGAIYQLLNCIYKTINFECLQPSFHEEVLREKFGKFRSAQRGKCLCWHFH